MSTPQFQAQGFLIFPQFIHLADQISQLEEKQSRNSKDKQAIVDFNFDQIKILEKIGEGSSGFVEKGIYQPQNLTIALKSISLNTDETFKKQLSQELLTLKSCDSPYITKCYGATFDQGIIKIALEYMDAGTLNEIYSICGKIPELILGFITYQVLKGLEYLHKNMKVIHRDIKPSNILLNSQGMVKIADFGVSGKIVNTNASKNSWVGTVSYMAPERLFGKKYKSNTDLWSLGVTILEAAIGKYPYISEDKGGLKFWDLMEIIQNNPIPEFGKELSANFRDFVQICLQKDPAKRKSATELLQHDFVKDYEGIQLNALSQWINCSKIQKFD